MDGAAYNVRDGLLYVEELACTELAARFGTPLYVMSETRLRSNVQVGVPTDDAVALGRAALDSQHIEFVGVHAHLARQTA